MSGLYGDGDQVDVLATDGQIAEIGTGPAPPDLEVIEGDRQVLLPGLVDLHTHLREPGREYAETIETRSAAAALGGFTAVFAMANTDPVADSPVVTDHVWRRGRRSAWSTHRWVRSRWASAGKKLTEMGLMAEGRSGPMFSDDGSCVDDPGHAPAWSTRQDRAC